jgi:hypothetical protein
MLVVMVVSSTPYIIATVRGRIEGGQAYLLSRIGEYTHAPHVIPLLALILGLLLVWSFGERLLDDKEHRARIIVLTLLLLAGIAGLNFQVVSGYDALHEKHFWNRLIQPVGFFLAGCGLLAAAENLKRRLPQVAQIAAAVLVIVLVNAGARQLYAGKQMAEQQRATRPEVELLGWVRSHLPAESVIGTLDAELVALIPTMGPNFSYVPMAMRTFTPTEEIVNRCHELASVLVSPDPSHRPQLACAGTPGLFSESYAQSPQAQRKESGGFAYKIDYVVDVCGRPVPPLIAARFPRSEIIHVNQRYQLIQLAAL